MDRRFFFKVVGAAAGTTLVGTAPRDAEAAATASRRADEAFGVLVDLTKCVGCRTCEASCAGANGLPAPSEADDKPGAPPRTTNDKQWTVVNRHDTSEGEVFAKTGCMHCVEPACAAACLTKALFKTQEGPIVWRADKCMGCRFCMVSCPFDAPKFEYDSWNPKIQKCQMGWEKAKDGGRPACVENCPAEALTFGKRGELLEVARQRIYQNPGQYVSHIYGEHEVGGTSWLYLSPVPFEELGFRVDLGTRPLPEASSGFLNAVPMAMVAVPALLLGLRRAVSRDDASAPDAPDAAEPPSTRTLPVLPNGLES